jgi:tRNA nucleotidyltransferase (CCA-adding enzyme)
MFEVLRECGALGVLLPEVDRLWGVPQRADHHPESGHRGAPDDGAGHGRTLWARHCRCVLPVSVTTWARARRPPMCCHATSGTRSAVQDCSGRCASACACRWSAAELAEVVAREHGNIHRSGELGAAALVRLLERCDAIRKPQRFAAGAAGLRMRCPRPPGLPRNPALPPARATAGGAVRRVVGRHRRNRIAPQQARGPYRARKSAR